MGHHLAWPDLLLVVQPVLIKVILVLQPELEVPIPGSRSEIRVGFKEDAQWTPVFRVVETICIAL